MEKIIACCGLNCAACDARIATITNDNDLRAKTAEKWKAQFNVTDISIEIFSLRNYDDGIFTSVSASPGLKYNFKSFFINAYVEFEFFSAILIPARYHSTNFGLSINYKIERKSTMPN